MSGYRDRLGEQLRVAATEQLAAPRARPARRRRLLVFTAAAALVCGGGTATALTLVSSAPDDPYDPVTTSPRVTFEKVTPLSAADLAAIRREREASQPEMDASRYFAVLRAPQTAQDREGGPERYADELRLAYRGPGGRGRVYLRATDREVCIYAYAGTGRGFSSGCQATATARTAGLYTFAECLNDPPQRRRVSGVVPDGITRVTVYRAGKLQATARVQRNGFLLDVSEPIDEIRVGRSSRRLPPVSC